MVACGTARTSAQGWGRWRANILGVAEIGIAARAPRGYLAEIDVGAKVMRQLVQTLIAAVYPLHHLADETRGKFLLVLRGVARLRSSSARRATSDSMIPLVATDTTDRMCHRSRPLCGHRR
jgi:hypothetical protein